MSSTFLDLTNDLLIDFNEVTINAVDFPNTRNVQAHAKASINKAINRINRYAFEWPFNYLETTQVLTKGTVEYDFPADFKIPDWDSFKIQKDDTLGVITTKLRKMNRDEYQLRAEMNDLDNTVDGIRTPSHVFKTNGNKFGVTPNPDKAYTVSYGYFKDVETLELYDDICSIPTPYDDIIISMATPYMHRFRSNREMYDASMNEAMEDLKRMKVVLINDNESMESTMVNFGSRYRNRKYINAG